MKTLYPATKYTNKQFINKFGVALLEGEPTITGHLIARKKCLAQCEKEAKKKNSDVYPSMVQSWIKSHKETIVTLENLIK